MKFFFFMTSIMLCNAVNAQPIPKFGEIDTAEMQLNRCEFDPEAPAVVLFDNGEFYCNIVYNSPFPTQILNERHVRIKILNDKGLDAANVHIRYYSFKGEERVIGIAAQTYNMDETGKITVTKLDKKLIYNKEINKRFSETVFTLPDVKAGSIIEYKYTISGSDDGRWYFQQEYPVQLSKYTLNFPNELEMTLMPSCTLPYTRDVERRSGRDVQVISMRNVPGLRNEPYISCREDFLQRADARIIAINPIGSPRRSLVRSWQGIIRNLIEDDDFGVQLKKEIPRTTQLDSILKGISDTFLRISAIHDYVRSNMEWDGQNSIWALDGVKSAWKAKKGNSGEINLILVNLLKDAGLNAHPILVSTRKNGKVNTFYPNLNQFDKVLAFVETDRGYYVLDGTDKFTPSSLIPAEVVATQGLVIEKFDSYQWGWRTLWNDRHRFEETIFWQGEVDNNGILKGNAVIESDNYARLSIVPKLKEGKEYLIKQLQSEDIPGFSIDSLTIENETLINKPLIKNVNFRHELSSSGKYQFIRTNLFGGMSRNPFIADTRFSDIFFGYNQRHTITANILLPDNYTVETLPKNIRMIMPDTSISLMRISKIENNMISLRITLAFNRPVFSAEEYGEFKEFYKQLFEFLSEQIVITKKEN